jgi:hypothetical protein
MERDGAVSEGSQREASVHGSLHAGTGGLGTAGRGVGG